MIQYSYIDLVQRLRKFSAAVICQVVRSVLSEAAKWVNACIFVRRAAFDLRLKANQNKFTKSLEDEIKRTISEDPLRTRITKTSRTHNLSFMSHT